MPVLPESFDLDHTRVRAPYVRIAGQNRTPSGDVITKFDLRLVQPNRMEIPTAALHTIEHLMAGYMRETSDADIVDLSPMGCRTGFYLVAIGEPDPSAMTRSLRAALELVAAHTGDIPGCSELECGNWRDHSLPGARAWAETVLQDEIIVQETILIDR